MKKLFFLVSFIYSYSATNAQAADDTAHPMVQKEIIIPLHKKTNINLTI
jgi:hypothetical protein